MHTQILRSEALPLHEARISYHLTAMIIARVRKKTWEEAGHDGNLISSHLRRAPKDGSGIAWHCAVLSRAEIPQDPSKRGGTGTLNGLVQQARRT